MHKYLLGSPLLSPLLELTLCLSRAGDKAARRARLSRLLHGFTGQCTTPETRSHQHTQHPCTQARRRMESEQGHTAPENVCLHNRMKACGLASSLSVAICCSFWRHFRADLPSLADVEYLFLSRDKTPSFEKYQYVNPPSDEDAVIRTRLHMYRGTVSSCSRPFLFCPQPSYLCITCPALALRHQITTQWPPPTTPRSGMSLNSDTAPMSPGLSYKITSTTCALFNTHASIPKPANHTCSACALAKTTHGRVLVKESRTLRF